MSPRLVGAVLASVAAILLVVSMAASAMWAGHPSVDGKVIEKKTVYIGLLGGQGCNTGGDNRCEDLSLSGTFTTVSFVQLGTSSLFVLVALLLALTAFKKAESRKTIAKAAIGVALLCVAVVIAQFVIGPSIKSNHEVNVPIGYGMFLFLGAVVALVLGGVLARKDDPPVSLRPSRQPIAFVPAQQQQPVDVLALLQQEDALRPTAPPLPAGMLPGPGPLGAGTGPSAPLFNAAPQLRPLYEAAPAQGGTHGYIPSAAAPLPMQPPAPIPRSQISAVAGIPTPPPMQIIGNGRADTSLDPAPPPPPLAAPPPLSARAKAASVAPPPRVKAPSIPPPARKLPAPGFSMKTSNPTSLGIAVPQVPPGSPMLPFTGAPEPSEEVATRALRQEPDLMVGTPLSVGDSTDAERKLPAEESTDVNARPVTDDGEDLVATVMRTKEEAEDDAATTARPKQDPEDLVTDPIQARASAKSMPKIPISTADESLPPPKEEKAAAGGPSPACPQCEAPMGWVEEHLRFYCKSCRMYF